MPLLLSSRKPKVKKLASGGGVDIPVYGSYQYKEAQQVPYNTASLLSKYQGIAPPKAVEKKDDNDKIKIEGFLDNDIIAFNEEWKNLNNQISNGIARNPDFEKTNAGRSLLSRKDDMSIVGVQIGKNRMDTWKGARTKMNKNFSHDDWFFKDGKGLVENQVTGQFEKVSGDQINLVDEETGGRIYKPVTYGAALNYSATSLNPMFVNQPDITAQVGYGYGNQMVNKEITDSLTGLGFNVTDESIEIGGVVVNGADVVKDATAVKTKSNSPQLEAAYGFIIDDLKNTPSWDNLEGRAYQAGMKSAGEAVQWIHTYLAQHIAAKTGLEVSTVDVLKYDDEIPDDGSGGGGAAGPLGVIGKFSLESMAAGAPTDEYLEFVNPDKKEAFGEERTVKMGIKTWKIPNADGLKDGYRTLDDNTELNKVVDIDRAMLPDGTFVSDIKFGGSSMGGVALPYLGSKNKMKLTFMPMRNGKPLNIPAKVLDPMNERIKEIQDRMDDELIEEGSQDYINLQNQIDKVTEDFLAPYEGAYVEKFYLMEVVYNSQWIEEGQRGHNYLDAVGTSVDDEEFSRIFNFADNEDNTKYTEAAGTNKEPYIYNSALEAHYDTYAHVEGADDFKKVTVMLPVNDLSVLQQIDQNIYVDKFNLTAGSTGAEPGNIKYGLTNEEIQKAIKASGTGGYKSIFEAQN